jgi:membrane-associated phospholipid phosphatase
MKSKQQRAQLNLSNRYKLKLISHRTVEVSEQVGNILINYTHFIIGLLINSNLTLIGKKTAGRLRPNFLDVCKPNTNPYSICRMNSANTYLRVDVDFKCTTLKQHEVIESRLSFPSGHASTIFYTVIFLILFIHRTWNKRSISAVAQFIQFSLFGLGIFVGLSRIVDNKHHPTDVLAGTILGTVVALSHFHYLNLFYKRYNYKNKYNMVSTNEDQPKELVDVESQVKETSFRKQNTLKTV